MAVISCPLVCVEYDEVSVGLVVALQIARQEDGRCQDRLVVHAPLSHLNLAPQAGA